MSGFSLAAVLDYLDSQPEQRVMLVVGQAYEDNAGRGLFSNKLVNYSDLRMLGYKGFRQMLVSLYEIDPAFVEQHRGELFAITRKLKGE